MEENSIVSRYAKAFFDVLHQENALEEGYQDMQKLLSLSREVTTFHNFLQTPIYSKVSKKKIVKKLLEGKISRTTLHFMLLVIDKKRDQYLEAIALDFIALYHNQKNEGKAVIELAHPVFSKALEASLVAFIKQVTNWAHVQLSVTVNPNLIGGYILTFKDRRIDASFQGKLQQLQHSWGESIFST